MKNPVLTALLLLLPAFLYADVYPYKSGEKPKMMVIVQSGEEAAVTASAKPAVTQAARAAVQAAKQPADMRILTAQELRQLAEKSSMENEIVDAVIAKLIDLEGEVKVQKTYNIVFGAALFFLLLLVVAGAVAGRPKKK